MNVHYISVRITKTCITSWNHQRSRQLRSKENDSRNCSPNSWNKYVQRSTATTLSLLCFCCAIRSRSWIKNKLGGSGLGYREEWINLKNGRRITTTTVSRAICTPISLARNRNSKYVRLSIKWLLMGTLTSPWSSNRSIQKWSSSKFSQAQSKALYTSRSRSGKNSRHQCMHAIITSKNSTTMKWFTHFQNLMLKLRIILIIAKKISTSPKVYISKYLKSHMIMMNKIALIIAFPENFESIFCSFYFIANWNSNSSIFTSSISNIIFNWAIKKWYIIPLMQSAPLDRCRNSER